MTTRRKAAAAAAAMPESAAGEAYVIEFILDVRKSRDGSREFLVKWLNYGPEWNTWEPGIRQFTNYQLFVASNGQRWPTVL